MYMQSVQASYTQLSKTGIMLFCQGEQGVTEVLQMLKDELKVAMGLAGLTNTNLYVFKKKQLT